MMETLLSLYGKARFTGIQNFIIAESAKVQGGIGFMGILNSLHRAICWVIADRAVRLSALQEQNGLIDKLTEDRKHRRRTTIVRDEQINPDEDGNPKHNFHCTSLLLNNGCRFGFYDNAHDSPVVPDKQEYEDEQERIKYKGVTRFRFVNQH
jgi:hypothetical protein